MNSLAFQRTFLALSRYLPLACSVAVGVSVHPSSAHTAAHSGPDIGLQRILGHISHQLTAHQLRIVLSLRGVMAIALAMVSTSSATGCVQQGGWKRRNQSLCGGHGVMISIPTLSTTPRALERKRTRHTGRINGVSVQNRTSHSLGVFFTFSCDKIFA